MRTTTSHSSYDKWLLCATLGIIALGLLMVASASIVISNRQFGEPFHYLIRQSIYLGAGVVLGFFIMRIDMRFWERVSGLLLIFSLFLLVVVLIPGIGHQVNGSIRWIGFGPLRMQVSELAKLCVIIYLAGYLVRHSEEVRQRMSGFIKPMMILGFTSILLLLEPDFGAAVVIMVTALGMMFLAGVRLWQFAVLLSLVLLSLAAIAVSSPYRLLRITAFLNPWANAFDSGYQLTQSLIAFGRGSWFGVGLGESVQKLFYLPEAHTDFLFAVLAEEFGLLGVFCVLILFGIVVTRALLIGFRAKQLQKPFCAFMAYGFAMWLGLQAMINMGVNTGVLPTKGLTLPLMSYGGSSMLIMCVVIALLLRIDYESRLLTSNDPRHWRKRHV